MSENKTGYKSQFLDQMYGDRATEGCTQFLNQQILELREQRAKLMEQLDDLTTRNRGALDQLDRVVKERDVLRGQLAQAKQLNDADNVALKEAWSQLVKAREGLDRLHAEIAVNLFRDTQVIKKGLDEGISTVPNSLPHERLTYSIPRAVKELEHARVVLTNLASLDAHPPTDLLLKPTSVSNCAQPTETNFNAEASYSKNQAETIISDAVTLPVNVVRKVEEALGFYAECGELWFQWQYGEDRDVDGATARFIEESEKEMRKDANEAISLLREHMPKEVE